MLIVLDKSTHEEHLSQPLQTKKKRFNLAFTFLIGYNGIFNMTSKNNNFYFAKPVSDEDGFNEILIPEGAYKIESLNNEIKRIIIEEEHYTEANYPFTIKRNFSTLGSFIEKSTQGPVISFVPDDRMRDILGIIATTMSEEYNISPNPVDILSVDNIFSEVMLLKE